MPVFVRSALASLSSGIGMMPLPRLASFHRPGVVSTSSPVLAHRSFPSLSICAR